MTNSNNITPFQLFFLLLHSQVGVGIVSLPYEVFQIAKGDSWISVLIAGGFVQILIVMFWLLMRRFPNETFYSIIQYTLGNWFGKVVNILIIIYFLCLGAVILARFSVIISAWLMPLTPKWILAGIVMITVLYISIEKLQTISRFFFISTLTFPIYIGFTIYALKDANVKYILPLGNSGVSSILEGALYTLWSVHGIEILLFVYPFVQSNVNHTIKTATSINVCVTILYTFVTLSCLLILSPQELVIVPEPVLYIVKSFSFKIIERPDLIITSLWLVIVVTSFIVITYTASLGISILFNTNRSKYTVFFTVVVIYLTSLILTGVYEVIEASKYFSYASIFFIFILPLLILIIAVITNKKVCDYPS